MSKREVVIAEVCGELTCETRDDSIDAPDENPAD